jgi:hypothetical protein
MEMATAFTLLVLLPVSPATSFDASTVNEINLLARRLEGAVLVRMLKEDMTETEVERLIGRGRLVSGNAGGHDCWHEALGIQVRYWGPGPIWYPAAKMGPEMTMAIGAIPCWWIQMIVVPALHVQYAPPCRLKEAQWIGFRAKK